MSRGPLYDVFNEFENVILTPHIGRPAIVKPSKPTKGLGKRHFILFLEVPPLVFNRPFVCFDALKVYKQL